MSVKNKTRILKDEIKKGREVLAKINKYGASFLKVHSKIWHDQKTEDAIVLAEIMTNTFTCLETIFLRISQHFENSLQKERWHQDLLHKMTLNIEDIREPVISDETHDVLLEFLKFRHFKRYYFEFNYDWDKLQFLFKKYEDLKSMINKDLGHFIKFLEKLVA
jgi:Uri superfamily endonuclease